MGRGNRTDNPHQQTLWQVAVSTSPGSETRIARLLTRLTGAPAVSYHDLQRQSVTVSVYLPKPPSHPQILRRAMAAGLRRSIASQPSAPRARLRIHRLPARNWTDSWKRHVRPFVVGGMLLIRPGWSRRRPQPGQRLIDLEPGLSFGTGHHPTTRFCLDAILRARCVERPASFLDVGTGSGLLAIAAAKLGYRPVRAFDSDPTALRVARANARRNRVAGRVALRLADLRDLSCTWRGHDLVCANLQADLLIRLRPQLTRLVRSTGTLVLAGILRREMPSVRRAFSGVGWDLARHRTEGGWTSGLFRRRDT